MSVSFLLQPSEVEELTGTPRVTLQLEWLQAHGIPAERGRDGKVKVLRAAIEARMMPSGPRQKAKTEPNLALLKKAS
jgi:predicted metalloendopeptidase